MKLLAIAAVFVIAQGVDQSGCRSQSHRRQPGVADGQNLPITDAFTTGDGIDLGVQTLITNVEVPWSLAFAPDGRLFFTERGGRVRVYQNGALLPSPALVLDDVRAEGEGGLMGIALHPAFTNNRFVYLLYTANTGSGVRNRLVRYREVNNTLADRAVLIDNIGAASVHDGGRLRFGPDNRLYATMGDAAVPALAQSLSSLNGKILRVNDDGSSAADNPFGSEVWTWGHRNPQGLAWDPIGGRMWATEHGQTGNDELNLIVRGRNYGWPVIEGDATRPDMERPVLFFSPAIAPSGLSFYTGTRIPGLRNDLFFATLRGQHIHRVQLTADRVAVQGAERWLENRFGRIRDVVIGPDGAIYFCTNNRDGRGSPVATDDRILRIVPR